MIDALSLALTALAVLTGVAVVASGLAGHYRRSSFSPALAVLQAGLVLQAVLDVVAQVRGHEPGERTTHLAYLVASLLVVPVAAGETRRSEGAWSATALVVALVVVAVIVVRMQTTWRAA